MIARLEVSFCYQTNLKVKSLTGLVVADQPEIEEFAVKSIVDKIEKTEVKKEME